MTTSQQPSYRQIQVGRFPVGITGLDEILAELYEAGKAPSEETAQELLSAVQKHNYVPASAAADYTATLLNEYACYYELRLSGRRTVKSRETWNGIPREQIAWFPVLDESLCDGCDKCLRFCANGVYARHESGTVHVVQPMNCTVGCDACARLCQHKAIAFPPRSILPAATQRT